MPPIWAIGDVQGCYQPLRRLLAQPALQADWENPQSQLWFAGDLINRGPNSLATLRHIMSLGDRAVCVLGNHDLNLLGVFAGLRKPGKTDTLDDILNAPDVEALIRWIRHRPLAHYAYGHLMVHAGVYYKWDAKKTIALAQEVSDALKSDNWATHLKKMYGNTPNRWRNSLKGSARRRAIINILTRMRLCFPDGSLDFKTKTAPPTGDNPQRLVPWFKVDKRSLNDTVVFGHWSTLGLTLHKQWIGLDSGCVWGRQLSAVRLHDRQLVQIDCSLL